MLEKMIGKSAASCARYLVMSCLLLLVTGCSRSPSPKSLNPYQSFALAAKKDDIKQVASILATHPALASDKTSEGITLLHLSAYGWGNDVTMALIKAGAKVNVLDSKGRTPLDWAVTNDRYSAASLLLKSGASPDLITRENIPPLMTAVLHRNFDMVKLLVEHGADVNYSGKGNSILQTAMLYSNKMPKMASYLKAHGAKLRADEYPGTFDY